MTDQSMFESNQEQAPQKPQGEEGQQQETPAPSNASSGDVFADQLASIKNERGEPKYSSVEEALKGAAHAQTYIGELKSDYQKLQEEFDKVRSELDKRESVEDVVERLTAQKDQGQEETPQPQQGLDEQSIEKLLDERLTAREKQQIQKQNVQSVQEALTKQFGDKTKEMVQAKAKELGVAPEKIGEMAQDSPKMVLELFKVAQSSKSSGKPTFGSERVPNEYAPKENTLEKPSKSLLAGATSQEQAEYMRKIREHTYNRLGVQTN